MDNDFISDNDFFKLLSCYDVEVEEGDGEIFIEETNKTVKVKEFLDELTPQLKITKF